MSSADICDDCGAKEAEHAYHYACEEDKSWHCSACLEKDIDVIKKEIAEQKFAFSEDDEENDERFWEFLGKLRDAGKIKLCDLCLWENSDYLQDIHPRTGGFAHTMGF
jgi:hypothetical protein